MHSGHRQRLKDRYLREGLSGFEKHNMLELLLFYAIPQKDTNPIAHELIARFGSLRGVFEAEPDDLCSVGGISMHTALLIKLIPDIYRAALCEEPQGQCYDSLNKLGKMLVRRFTGLKTETILLVLLDNRYRLIDVVRIGEGSVNQVRVDTRALIEAALRKNAAMAVLSHNHPNGSLVPSPDDLTTTAVVADAFQKIHVEFLEHLLIAGDRFEPLLSKMEGAFWQKGKTAAFYGE